VAQAIADGLCALLSAVRGPSGIHPMADYAVRRRGRRLPSLVRGHERGYWTDEGTFAIDATRQTSILSKRTLIFSEMPCKVPAAKRHRRCCPEPERCTRADAGRSRVQEPSRSPRQHLWRPDR